MGDAMIVTAITMYALSALFLLVAVCSEDRDIKGLGTLLALLCLVAGSVLTDAWLRW